MGINLGTAITGAIEGGVMGGPTGALVGGVAGAVGGEGGGATAAENGINSELQTASLISSKAQADNEIQYMQHNTQMNARQTWFNEMAENQSQQLSETNSLRDIAMQQRKADMSITKEFIQSIKE